MLKNSICVRIIMWTDRTSSPVRGASRNRVWPWTRVRNPVPTELSGPAPKIFFQHNRPITEVEDLSLLVTNFMSILRTEGWLNLAKRWAHESFDQRTPCRACRSNIEFRLRFCGAVPNLRRNDRSPEPTRRLQCYFSQWYLHWRMGPSRLLLGYKARGLQGIEK